MNRDRIDAYHEASHAVVSILSGDPFAYVCLCEIKEGSRIVTGRLVYPKEADGLAAYIYQEDALRVATIRLAGAIANKVLRPRRPYKTILDNEALDDFLVTQNLVGLHLFAIPEYKKLSAEQQVEVDRFIRKNLFPRVRKLAKSNWDKIARVGDALVVQRKLLCAHVKRLMSNYS